KTTPRNGRVVGVELLRADEGVMLITEKGMIIRLNTKDISTIGRNTQGVRLIQLDEETTWCRWPGSRSVKKRKKAVPPSRSPHRGGDRQRRSGHHHDRREDKNEQAGNGSHPRPGSHGGLRRRRRHPDRRPVLRRR